MRYSSPLPTSQSIAFLKLPGSVPAYSGVQNTTASADASSSRSAVTVCRWFGLVVRNEGGDVDEPVPEVATTPGTSSSARVRSAAVFVDPARVLPEMRTTYTGPPVSASTTSSLSALVVPLCPEGPAGRASDRLRKAYGG